MTSSRDPSKQQPHSTGRHQLRISSHRRNFEPKRRVSRNRKHQNVDGRSGPRRSKNAVANSSTTDIGTTANGTLSMSALATLTVGNIKKFVSVDALSCDSMVPGILHVAADPETVDIAYHHKRVKLSLLGMSVQTRVLGRLTKFAVLLLSAEPLFRALANQLGSLRRNKPHLCGRDDDKPPSSLATRLDSEKRD
jgi:hypothetical protein